MIYSYHTISLPSEGTFSDSGSKFLAYAFPADNKSDVDGHLQTLRSEHPKARHHCYAYRLIEGNEVTEFASDAGEPSGSAGQPILGELKRRDLVNLCVIVVRYFGGTKLGIPGLIHAYRESTHQALESAQLVHRIRTRSVRIEMPIALQPILYSAAKRLDMEISDPEYGQRFTATLAIPLEHSDTLLARLIFLMAGTEGNVGLLCEKMGVVVQ